MAVGFLSEGAFVTFKNGISEYLEIFQEMYKGTIHRMNVEKKFEILPESASSCNYCPGAAICSRHVEGTL